MEEFMLQQLVCFVGYKQEMDIESIFDTLCANTREMFGDINHLSPDMIPNSTINNYVIEISSNETSKATATISINNNNVTIVYNLNEKIFINDSTDSLLRFFDFIQKFYRIHNNCIGEYAIKKVGVVGYFPHTTMVTYLHNQKENIQSRNMWKEYHNSVRNFKLSKINLESGLEVEIVKNGFFDFDYIGNTEQPLKSKNIIDVTTLIKTSQNVTSCDLESLLMSLQNEFNAVFERMFRG